MNQKYIDFVPSKKTSASVPVRGAGRSSVSTSRSAKVSGPAVTVSREAQSRSEVQRKPSAARSIAKAKLPTAHVNKSASKDSFSIKKEPTYGVIEDFRPKFVKTEVEKRPLSRSHFTATGSELSRLKSQNVKKSSRNKAVEQPADTAVSDKESLTIPKSPFIAKAKVTKRPLSKNVYTKPVSPTKEPSTDGPVTIISKPESGGKGGMILAIILTIILGAVAGTIAFLILPK